MACRDGRCNGVRQLLHVRGVALEYDVSTLNVRAQVIELGPLNATIERL